MFGIGLPEMILILALALIVVGPDKLPDLARSVAKGVMELKKTAEALKKNLTEEGNPVDEIREEINKNKQALTAGLLEDSEASWKTLSSGEGVNPSSSAPATNIIDAVVIPMNEQAAPGDSAVVSGSSADSPSTNGTAPNTPVAPAQEASPTPPC